MDFNMTMNRFHPGIWSCRRSYCWLFGGGPLISTLPADQATQHHQTHFVHGMTRSYYRTYLPVSWPTPFYDVLLDCSTPENRRERPTYILRFYKGTNKYSIRATALKQSLSLHILVRRRTTAISQLCPWIGGQHVSTRFEANEYAVWLPRNSICTVWNMDFYILLFILMPLLDFLPFWPKEVSIWVWRILKG